MIYHKDLYQDKKIRKLKRYLNFSYFNYFSFQDFKVKYSLQFSYLDKSSVIIIKSNQ